MIKKNWGLIILIAILFNLVFLLSSFNEKISDKKVYYELYQKNNVKFNSSILENKTNEIIGFFNDKNSLDNSFFTNNEISHMSDVKKIFSFLEKLHYLSLFLLLTTLIYLIVSGDLFKILLPSLIIGFLLAIFVLLIFYFVPFSTSFDGMHQTFFPHGNYSFPENSNLILLFPFGFFEDFTKIIIKDFLLKELLIVLLTIGSFYMIKMKNKKIY